MKLTLEILKNIIDSALPVHVEGLNSVMEKYKINTPNRICHFLAQIIHESGGFKHKVENLNYSAQGLLNTFSKYFNVHSANHYARKPELIANKVYANRMDNGNEASGDGWKYRGRGAIQLTGKSNYRALSNASKIDFLNNPDLLTEDKYYFEGAGWYWNVNNINSLADQDDLGKVRKAVNGGTIGLVDCSKYLLKAKKYIL